MTALTEQDIAGIRTGLLTWFELNRRDLPWRRTRDPYRILISEVMLQQTQVDRVIPYYERFLDRFPDVQALAEAPASEVIRLWSGLGYNRRAVNLQRTAQAVVNDHGGEFPRDVAALRTLPGIGPYTAGAIACFAFEQDVAFIDTNMRRVIHRLVAGPELPEPQLSEKEIVALAAALVPPCDGWRWNQGLIEFGALQCTARKPACIICPLREICVAAPVIHASITSLPKGTRLKNEGKFEGSNRQYRGRILRALQASPAGLTLLELGPAIHEEFNDERLPWLAELVEALTRDGLTTIAESPAHYDETGGPALIVKLPD
ncbi:MAG: A/G-specific adenine glycosylase [Thermomicrobiales bacterium]|nr:A/G-specific adenine glycosylase [Thermomicrobiales bacterium]